MTAVVVRFTYIKACRQYLEASPKFVAFTCGLVRGSLANLGNTIVKLYSKHGL